MGMELLVVQKVFSVGPGECSARRGVFSVRQCVILVGRRLLVKKSSCVVSFYEIWQVISCFVSWFRNNETLTTFSEKGAVAAKSPLEVAELADAVITMLPSAISVYLSFSLIYFLISKKKFFVG